MATIYESLGWHAGEHQMHELTKVPEHENPSTHGLTPQAAYMLQAAPLLALGTLDSEGRPWTTLLGGEAGFSRPLSGPIIGVRADVDAEFDPVIEAFVPKERRKEQVVRYDDGGKILAGLAIDLMARRRVKVAGRMVAGAVSIPEMDEGDEDLSQGTGELQMAIKIEESLGNCPKYLNKKHIHPAPTRPQLISDSPKLSTEAMKLINKADLFFISSTQANRDMDTNYRGGPPGFVRVISNSSDGAELIYPEYSGNRLYQTLGNLKVTPLAGIVIPNFETGDVLYVTGTTEVLVGKDASDILPHSNLAVKIKITASRYVKEGLAFRGIPDEFSPYNPNIRLLASEGNIAAQLKPASNTAKLLERQHITPTISRYKFSITNPTPYKPGQWVAMDFSKELDIGYSHMRDEDPRSLNDDYIRTFTVSSPPQKEDESQNEFELTVRLHGPVTEYLKRCNLRSSLEVPLKGFGGNFVIETSESSLTPFIAGGVGITPLLGQLNSLDVEKLSLQWIIRLEDIDFVLDIFGKYPELAKHATVFFTGSSAKSISSEASQQIQTVRNTGAMVEIRRPEKNDFEKLEADKWYLCAGKPLRNILLEWLEAKTVVYEDFDY